MSAVMLHATRNNKINSAEIVVLF